MGSKCAPVEKVDALRGLMDTFFTLHPQRQAIDFRRAATRREVPVYLLSGDPELAGRRELALERFERLPAPARRLCSFSSGGHATAFEHADAFRRILVQTVVPATYDAP